MADRSCRPHHTPGCLPERTERRIIKLRMTRRLGPARIAWALRLNHSAVHQLLCRYHCHRLVHLHGPTAVPVRRYERDPVSTTRPSELIHVDVKFGNVSDGGAGSSCAGRRQAQQPGHHRPGRDATAIASRSWATALRTALVDYARLPTPRSCRTSETKPGRRSCCAHMPGTPASASPSSGSCPTTDPASDRNSGPLPAPSSPSSAGAPGPTGPRPTPKSNASTAL
jgi:hypothetical protein